MNMSLNLIVIETVCTDSVDSPFGPPLGWEGDDDDYMELLRARYKDPQYSQRIASLTRRTRKGAALEYRGPWAHCAEEIIRKLNDR